MSVLNAFQGGGASASRPKAPSGASANPDAKATWGDIETALELGGDDALTQPASFCNALEFLLDRTKAVRIEVANSRLRLIAPVIKDHGVEYERNHMDKKLREGLTMLTKTRRWLRETIRRELAAGRSSLDDLTNRDSTKASAYMAIINAGVVALITGAKPPRVASCPETFMLDVTRLEALHAAFRLMVLAASVLVIVGQRLGEVGEKDPKQVITAVAKSVIATAPSAGNLTSVIDTVVAALKENSTMDEAHHPGLHAVLLRGVEANRPVPKLMESRLRGVLQRGLEQGCDMFQDQDSIGKVFKESQLPHALLPLVPHLRDACLRTNKVVLLNTKVHAARYNSMIAGESAGFVTWRCSITATEPVPPGFRFMTVIEAQDRLPELVEHSRLGERTVRLLDGRIKHISAVPTEADTEMTDASDTLPVRTATWEVVKTDVADGETEAMVVPLCVDKIALAPGETAPAGFRLMRADEVSTPRWKDALVLGWMEEWSIVRVDGGKLDGSGYGGEVTFGDFTGARYIGEALVVPK
jgi:hypothetical protein